ncbi:MAG: hypothetical protein EPO62_05025 [Candidatus Nitrosotenuis sp.]|nr:MAG: hypothetical protein EPO62_05025 [Candidatus Nitrosotenuis sp.]
METFLALVATFVLGAVFLSAYGEPICNPYTPYGDCADSTCDERGGTGHTMSILHFNPQMRGYEFPSEYHVGETYFLHGFVSNDNYCKKNTTVVEEYQNYKSNPVGFSSAKYEDIKFSFVVRISKTDDNGKSKVTYLDQFNGTVKPKDKKMHTFEWVPQEDGKYVIERFIYDDVNSTTPMAPKYAVHVDVSGKLKQTPNFMTPIEKYEYGLSLMKNQESKKLVVAIKASGGKMVSVTPETKEKLIERGWAKPV